jgi:hypothetical protein
MFAQLPRVLRGEDGIRRGAAKDERKGETMIDTHAGVSRLAFRFPRDAPCAFGYAATR